MMASVMGKVGKMANPATYTTAWTAFTANLHADVRKGSIKPLFKLMLTVGTVGYGMEYYGKGSTCKITH